jgi:hypothetical protein
LQRLDSQDGALQCYYYLLNRLLASRLLLPRSGLERSDFVQWPIASFRSDGRLGRCWGMADIEQASTYSIWLKLPTGDRKRGEDLEHDSALLLAKTN